MRAWKTLVMLAFAAGCSSSTEAGTGTVTFQIDPATCTAFTAPIVYDFYVDLVAIGSAPMSRTQPASFAVKSGTHSFRAIRQTASRNQTDWTGQVVSAGQTLTLTTVCPNL